MAISDTYMNPPSQLPYQPILSPYDHTHSYVYPPTYPGVLDCTNHTHDRRKALVNAIRPTGAKILFIEVIPCYLLAVSFVCLLSPFLPILTSLFNILSIPSSLFSSPLFSLSHSSFLSWLSSLFRYPTTTRGVSKKIIATMSNAVQITKGSATLKLN